MQLSKDYYIEGEILKKGTIVEVVSMDNPFQEKANPDIDMMKFIKGGMGRMSVKDFSESFAISLAMTYRRESRTPSEDIDEFVRAFNEQINYVKSKFSL